MSLPILSNCTEPSSLPHVWRVSDLAVEEAVLPSGHVELDMRLPGGGWPMGNMVEVLQQHPFQHAWQLLLPVLSQAVLRTGSPVVLVGAPYHPFGPSLKAQGLSPEALICVNTQKSAARLWAAEQALRCADVAAVMAWLPKATSGELRRLHVASQQNRRLLFVFRGLEARFDASPARLRMVLEGNDSIELHIFKRRGPPIDGALSLKAYPQEVRSLLSARRKKAGAYSPK